MPGQTKIRWFDTHVHLDRYSDPEVAAMTARAGKVGVTRMLAVSTSVASSQRTVALPGKTYKAVGIHPTRAVDATTGDWLDELRRLATTPGVVAIGETGFDAAGPEWPVQRACFVAQAGLAREFDLALVLHIDGEGAWARFVDSGAAVNGLRAVRHYFRGDASQADWHVGRGHYLSFGRPLLRDTGLQAIAATYPAELLLIETDTYPVTARTTEPEDLVPVGELLAQLRGWSVQACAGRLWENSVTALGLDHRPAAAPSD